MKINEVKTAFKIADVKILRRDILEFEYITYPCLKDEEGKVLDEKFLSKNVGRVYIFSVDGIIKKIGGSENVKGMKGTLEIYKNGGLNGQPSSRSIGIWWHLFHELVNNRKIEVHMIYQDNFPGKVKGLFGLSEQNVSISYKHIENACLADYYSVEKRYPDWNYQENNIPWESEIDAILTITKENKGKKGKEKNLDFAKTLKEKGFDTRITRSSEDYDKSENI